MKQKLHDHPRSIETASYMLAFEWWESLQVPRDQKYRVLLEAVRSTGNLTTAAVLEGLLEERTHGRENLAHEHSQPYTFGGRQQLQLNCHASIQSASADADTLIVKRQVINGTTADNTECPPKFDESAPEDKGLSDKKSVKHIAVGLCGEVGSPDNSVERGTSVSNVTGGSSHIKLNSNKGSSGRAISGSKGRSSIDIFKDIDVSYPGLDLDVFSNRNGNAGGGNFQTGVANGHTGVLNGQAGVANDQTGVMKGQTGVVNGQTGVGNGQTGVVNGQTGVVNGQTGVVNSQTGVLNGQTGVMKGQTGVVNGQTGVVNGQTGVANGQAGVVNGQTGVKNGYSFQRSKDQSLRFLGRISKLFRRKKRNEEIQKRY